MKCRHLWAMILLTGLLCGVDGQAAITCGLAPGNRVDLLVNHPWGAPYLHIGHRGTVVCIDTDDYTLPLLISFDDWYWGLSDGTTGWCHTLIEPHEAYTLWWTGCNDVKGITPNVPDLLDRGEPDRSFKPQTLIAGKPNQTLEVSFEVVNGGTGYPLDATCVDVYASQDTWISPSDYKLGTTSYFYLGAGASLQKTLKVVWPTNIPAGLYYIGWIIDPANLVPDELDEMNNVACLESYRLLVSAPAGTMSLELSAARGGSITTPGEGVFTYMSAQTISVVAAADPNCTFARWKGTAVDAGKVGDPGAASTEVIVDAKYSLTAVFDGAHMVVEDFEDYNEASPLNSTWVDGIPWRLGEPLGRRGNETGSLVGIAEEPTPGNPTIHGGLQAMAFHYDNRKTPYYSEASRRWGSLQNWSATGADKLSIWYRGAASNAAQPLYVVVEDFYRKTAVARHPDGRAVLAGEWTQWTIPLQQIQAAGVMLSRVTGMCIGVGEKNSPIGAGAGTLYFDDIALVHE